MGFGLTKKGARSGEHVSMWPLYFPEKKRERGLAFLSWGVDKHGDWDGDPCVINHENGVCDNIASYADLVAYAFKYNIDVYVYKMVKANGFPWFDDAMQDREHATPLVANSSETVTMISIRGKRNRQVKIISTAVWGWRKLPTLAFLQGLRHVFDEFNYGAYPSPASLGQNTIKMTMPRRRFSRPSAMLRDRLLYYGSGGRADDFADHEVEYEQVYETDFDNFYAEEAKWGVPVDKYETMGRLGVFTDNLEYLGEFRLCFVECRITIQEWNKRKISPFYTRHADGMLHWETEPGVYYGWYWTPMIARCLRAGYKVEWGYAWGWRTLSKFMNPFIEHALATRKLFKKQGFELEADLMKGVIVGAFGTFGTQPWKWQLVPACARQEGDKRFLDLEARPKDGLLTKYYLRKIEEPNSPHLTQVLYAIIAYGNVALYDLAVSEEEAGNNVLMTNYDAIYTSEYPKIAIIRKKVKLLQKFRSLGKRTFTHSNGEKRPGVKKRQYDTPISASLPYSDSA